MAWWQWVELAWLTLGVGLLILAQLSVQREQGTAIFSMHDWPVSLGVALILVLGAPFFFVYLLSAHGDREPGPGHVGRRLMLWLQIEQPPYVGTRCGTPLIGASPERWRKAVAAWEAHEAAYIDWVKAHPRPKKEWVERMIQLTEMRKGS